MGCPDWPKCFGAWVPPTSVSELPSDYKNIYSAYRHKKNERFAKYLSAFGFSNTARAILNDPSIRQEADFNPLKTSVEYVNRIVGVTIGIFIFAVFVYSLRYRKTESRLTWVALISLVLVGLQGWLGSFVVSTNLTPWTITVHMFLALLIVALLIYLINKGGDLPTIDSKGSFWWLVACIAVLLVQILLGTHVREAVDAVGSSVTRQSLLDRVGSDFIIHRSFSWLVLILHVVLVLKLRKTEGAKPFPLILILLILGTILSGLGMAMFSIPPFLQPIHLLLATLTFGMQFLFLLRIREKKIELVL